MSTEAQKRASEKYRLSHKEYYSKKSNEYTKKVRQQRTDYKARIDKAIDYINKFWKEKSYYESIENCLKFADMNEFEYNDLLNILQGENNE